MVGDMEDTDIGVVEEEEEALHMGTVLDMEQDMEEAVAVVALVSMDKHKDKEADRGMDILGNKL